MFLEETGRTGDVVLGDRYKYEIDRDAAAGGGQADGLSGNLFG